MLGNEAAVLLPFSAPDGWLSVWREVMVICAMPFFGFFFTLFILSQFFGVKL